MPFDHPLCVVYSSGTTGLPKGRVHGHGGILLEMLKLQGLHRAIREKASPRHVPAGPPRGQPDTVDDPSLLDLFADLRAQRYPS